jgi:hypothetical protein
MQIILIGSWSYITETITSLRHLFFYFIFLKTFCKCSNYLITSTYYLCSQITNQCWKLHSETLFKGFTTVPSNPCTKGKEIMLWFSNRSSWAVFDPVAGSLENSIKAANPCNQWWQDKQCTYKHNTEAHLHNHYCHGKAISITHSECVSAALVVQHAKCMCPITLSSVACLALPHFSILSHKRHDLKKNYWS